MFKNYLLGVTLLFALLMLITAGFNWLVNPYGVLPDSNLNLLSSIEYKPERSKVVRMYKAHDVARVRPQILLIGTSRTDTGLDPRHPSLAKRGLTYNSSLSSARVSEVLAYIKHAHAISPLRHVVLGVDISMFDPAIQHEVGFSKERLAHAPTMARFPSLLRDYATSLLSLDALVASYDTIFNQQNLNIEFDRAGGPSKSCLIAVTKIRAQALIRAE